MHDFIFSIPYLYLPLSKMVGNSLTLDLIGIIMAILATYLSGIYYAFWCEPYWRDFYLTTVGGFFIIGNQKHSFTLFSRNIAILRQFQLQWLNLFPSLEMKSKMPISE